MTASFQGGTFQRWRNLRRGCGSNNGGIVWGGYVWYRAADRVASASPPLVSLIPIFELGEGVVVGVGGEG